MAGEQAEHLNDSEFAALNLGQRPTTWHKSNRYHPFNERCAGYFSVCVLRIVPRSGRRLGVDTPLQTTVLRAVPSGRDVSVRSVTLTVWRSFDVVGRNIEGAILTPRRPVIFAADSGFACVVAENPPVPPLATQ